MTRRFDFAPANPVLRILFTVLLVSPRSAWVALDESALRVRFGVGFRATIALSSVTPSTSDRRPILGWGVHGFAGRWLVNTSSRGIVALDIAPAARGFVLGFPVRLRHLRLSLAEPALFLRALEAP